MAESIVIDFLPIALQEGGHQQQKGGLGLVEVRDHATHDMVFIPRGNDDLGGGMENIQLMLVHIGEEGLEGVESRDGRFEI